jgi:hypothetical protein
MLCDPSLAEKEIEIEGAKDSRTTEKHLARDAECTCLGLGSDAIARLFFHAPKMIDLVYGLP